jgi:hypothetical protein
LSALPPTNASLSGGNAILRWDDPSKGHVKGIPGNVFIFFISA